MTPAALRASNALVVDVRDAEELAAGTVPGAQHVPIDRVEAHFAAHPREAAIVFVCTFGQRSSSASAKLRSMGFTRTDYLEGGLTAWARAGMLLVIPGKA